MKSIRLIDQHLVFILSIHALTRSIEKLGTARSLRVVKFSIVWVIVTPTWFTQNKELF